MTLRQDYGGTAATAATLGELLRVQSLARGPHPALLDTGGRRLTYAELYRRVVALGDVLRGRGIGRADRVALMVPDGFDTAVATLAVAAHAVCLPVNPTLREPELRRLLARVRPRAVVVAAERSVAGRLATDLAADLGAEVLTLAGPSGTVRPVSPRTGTAGGDRREPAPAAAGDVAFLLATSGTTGRSKLVPLTHRNVLAGARATVSCYGLDVADRRLNVMPLFHVQGLVGSLVASLAAGSSIVLAEGFLPDRMPDWIRRWGVTWYSASPTMHRQILDRFEGRLDDLATSGLRFLRAGSGPLPESLRERLERNYLLPVVESYGMTEAHQIASSPLDPGLRRPGTIGRPTGSDVAILSGNGAGPLGLSEVGEVGEVVIRGANVIGGYLDDAEANRVSFVDGWFRTGDLGSLDADGYLTLHGRIKEIINRGGEKISPAEIDEVLADHPSVADAVTFPVPHDVLQEDVGVAIVPGDQELRAEDVRKYAAERLAPFKVPRTIVFVDALPRGRGGKINRRDVAESLGQVTAAEQEEESVVTTSHPLEAAVAGIWQDVLALPSVDPEEDFFFLGGDSLTGAQILHMVHQAFEVELSPYSMYDEAHTVRGMARLILAEKSETA
ncbi:non-ribosomal peptide synthetase [Streptomyces sp. B6B3]|uniref:non-ribosomal peptide synthetase n=1 Tax=Streptomyces sp. B6B3 TaxID=3153570 RepID=UPI00325D8637